MLSNDSSIDNNVGPSLNEQFLVYDLRSGNNPLRLRNKKATTDGKNALGKNENDITVARDGICAEWETEEALWPKLTLEQRTGFDHAAYPGDKLYFLKTPSDTIEYFAEGLAGLMAEGMFKKKILDESYQKCFSPAIPVIVGDPENPESFSLLQHCAPLGYQEMYKLKDPRQQKKNNFEEWCERQCGRGYEYILKKGQPVGFSYAFMMEAIICCNFSVHSANWMVRQRDGKLEAMLIDYGAAFRSIGSAKHVLEKNNGNPMISLEEGERVFTTFKKYQRYFKTTPNFFRSVQKHASQLLKKLQDNKQKIEDLRALYNISTIDMLNITKQKVKREGKSWPEERANIMRYVYGEHWSKADGFDLNECLKHLTAKNNVWLEKRANIIQYLYRKDEKKNAKEWIISCVSIIQTATKEAWIATERAKIEQYLLDYFDKDTAKQFKEQLKLLAILALPQATEERQTKFQTLLKELIKQLSSASLSKRVEQINQEEPITGSTAEDSIEKNQDKYAALIMSRMFYKVGIMRLKATEAWVPENGWDNTNSKQDDEFYMSAAPTPIHSPRESHSCFSFIVNPDTTSHASSSSSSSGTEEKVSLPLSCETNIDDSTEHDDDPEKACVEAIFASPCYGSSSFQRHVNQLLGQLCDKRVFLSSIVDNRLSCVQDTEYLKIGQYAADNLSFSKKTIADLILTLSKEKDAVKSLIELYIALQLPVSHVSDPSASLFDMFITGLKAQLIQQGKKEVYDALVISCIKEIECLWCLWYEQREEEDDADADEMPRIEKILSAGAWRMPIGSPTLFHAPNSSDRLNSTRMPHPLSVNVDNKDKKEEEKEEEVVVVASLTNCHTSTV